VVWSLKIVTYGLIITYEARVPVFTLLRRADL
jgi:hypothetical protein